MSYNLLFLTKISFLRNLLEHIFMSFIYVSYEPKHFLKRLSLIKEWEKTDLSVLFKGVFRKFMKSYYSIWLTSKCNCKYESIFSPSNMYRTRRIVKIRFQKHWDFSKSDNYITIYIILFSGFTWYSGRYGTNGEGSRRGRRGGRR